MAQNTYFCVENASIMLNSIGSFSDIVQNQLNFKIKQGFGSNRSIAVRSTIVHLEFVF